MENKSSNGWKFFALLFGLMLFATYNDIVRLVTGVI